MVSADGTPNVLALFVLAVGTLAIAWTLAKLDGPEKVFETLRQRNKGNFLGEVLDCWMCLSFWIAGLLLAIWLFAIQVPLAQMPLQLLLFTPCIAGGAWLLAYATGLDYSRN